MEYKKFIEMLKEKLKSSLAATLGEVEFSVETITKANIEYDGLMCENLKREGVPVPIINLNELHDAFLHGVSIDTLVNNITRELSSTPNINVEAFDEYSNIRDKITFKICNTVNNREFLKNVPHKEISDLALTYFVQLQHDETGCMGLTLTNQLLEKYGVTPEQVHEDAIKASNKINQPWLMSMERALFTGPRINLLECGKIPETEDVMYILSNEEAHLGAAVIGNPAVLEQVGDVLGENFTILPSSIHEVIVLPESKLMDIEYFRKVIAIGNEGYVSPDEILSYEPYHYDIVEKTFEHLETYLTKVSSIEKEVVQPKFSPTMFSSAEFDFANEKDKSFDKKLN